MLCRVPHVGRPRKHTRTQEPYLPYPYGAEMSCSSSCVVCACNNAKSNFHYGLGQFVVHGVIGIHSTNRQGLTVPIPQRKRDDPNDKSVSVKEALLTITHKID